MALSSLRLSGYKHQSDPALFGMKGLRGKGGILGDLLKGWVCFSPRLAPWHLHIPSGQKFPRTRVANLRYETQRVDLTVPSSTATTDATDACRLER